MWLVPEPYRLSGAFYNGAMSGRIARILITVACGLLAVMWVYAFVFAPRESFNKIGDSAWQAKAEALCQVAEDQRFSMEDLTAMDPDDMAAMKVKADLVDRATDSLEAAINQIEKMKPADAKGQAIVPEWIADYRTYLSDRRAFAVALRTAIRRPFFAESEIGGVPVSEKIAKFARENNMRTCQPPYDLSV